MQFLRQSTASQSVTIGAFVDDTDGKTEETGLTIANTDIKLIKNGGASVNKNSGGGTHRVNGQYGITIDATDSNTVGSLRISIVVAGALSVWEDFIILEEAVYDLFFAAAATGDMKLQGVTHTGAVIPTVTTLTNLPAITASWLTAAGIAAGALDNKGNWNIGKTGYSLAATGLDAIVSTATGMVEIAKAIWDRVLTGATHNIAASAGRRLRSVGDVVSGTVNDAAATTTSFISTLTGAHDEHFSDQTLFFTDGALSGMSRIITSYTSATKEVTFDEPLPAAPGNGDAFDVNPVHVHTQSQIAEVVWNALTLAHSVVGSFGKAVSDALADTNELQTDWTDGGRLDNILDARMAEASIDTTAGAVDSVLTNADMRGTDNALLAASVPANFGALVITAGGAVDSLVQGFLNTLIAETTAGRIAANISTFFANADALTTKVVDDVGGAGGAGDWTAAEKNEIRGRLGITGTTAAGGNTPTLATATALAVVDGIVDAILVDTGITIPALIALVQADLDAITDVDGVVIGAAGVDLIWDETVSDHVLGGTTGKALRDINDTNVSVDGSVNDAGATAGAFITNLTEASNNHYKDQPVTFTDGVLKGQTKNASGYVGATNQFTFSEPFTEAPGNGDNFVVGAMHVHSIEEMIAATLASGDVDGFTIEETLKLVLASAVAKLSGAETPTIIIRAADDSKDRITATVDALGNRLAVTLDGAG